jgi:hypothetical protein
MDGRWSRCAAGALIFAALTSLSGAALATEHVAGHHIWLACENGRNYPVQPIAVSRENDLVTGFLVTTRPGHGVHLRLVPMGAGYRYAGAGIWFDGERGQAVLDWGRPGAVPCTVMQE